MPICFATICDGQNQLASTLEHPSPLINLACRKIFPRGKPLSPHQFGVCWRIGARAKRFPINYTYILTLFQTQTHSIYAVRCKIWFSAMSWHFTAAQKPHVIMAFIYACVCVCVWADVCFQFQARSVIFSASFTRNGSWGSDCDNALSEMDGSMAWRKPCPLNRINPKLLSARVPDWTVI